MIDPVDRDALRKNLTNIAGVIYDLEHFIFYGTMLGIVREGDIIEHDDDIDILMNIDERDKLIDRLKRTDFDIDFTRPFNKKSKCFLQAHREIEEETVYVDFYFYENSCDNDYIIDRWNFRGACNTPSKALHIPKELIYPIGSIEFNGTSLKLPHRSEELCAFLYGETWRTPVKKNSEYTIEIENNKPKFVRKNVTTSEDLNGPINISDLDETGKALASHYKNLENLIADLDNSRKKLIAEKNTLEPIIRSHLKKR